MRRRSSPNADDHSENSIDAVQGADSERRERPPVRSDARKATKTQFDEIRAQIKADGETTRHHFEMMVERMDDSIKVIAEATAHHATRIDNHETRLKRLERPRRR